MKNEEHGRTPEKFEDAEVQVLLDEDDLLTFERQQENRKNASQTLQKEICIEPSSPLKNGYKPKTPAKHDGCVSSGIGVV